MRNSRRNRRTGKSRSTSKGRSRTGSRRSTRTRRRRRRRRKRRRRVGMGQSGREGRVGDWAEWENGSVEEWEWESGEHPQPATTPPNRRNQTLQARVLDTFNKNENNQRFGKDHGRGSLGGSHAYHLSQIFVFLCFFWNVSRILTCKLWFLWFFWFSSNFVIVYELE